MPYEFSTIDYNGDYWKNEYTEAVRREKEDCCIRAAELIYLSKIPVRTMLDFGCGLGITVKWLRDTFGIEAFGIDKFGKFIDSNYLFKEDLLYTDRFKYQSIDAIISVEVLEHLPQNEIIPIFLKLKDILKPGGLMMINSGTLEFTEESISNQRYIDPVIRGHISIFSRETFKTLSDIVGLIHIPMWSRSWCTLFYKPKKDNVPIGAWTGKLKENKKTLLKSKTIYYTVIKTVWAEIFIYLLKIPRKTTERLNKAFGWLLKW